MDAGRQERAEELATQRAGQIRTQQDLSAMMRMMMKAVMERALDAELDVHLGRRKVAVSSDATASAATPVGATYQADEPSGQRSGNRRNGHSKKTVQAARSPRAARARPTTPALPNKSASRSPRSSATNSSPP